MRIVLILPCCIGDVILATATLAALRRAYPQAHITWAVSTWARPAIERHPLLNAVLDTGPRALPLYRPFDFLNFVLALRAAEFELAVSLVRSPLMSAALWLTRIPQRVGLDSGGRGFGYTLRVPVQPQERRHEAEIYLDTARALGIDVSGCRANIPVLAEDARHVADLLATRRVQPPYLVVHPGGGSNPGMTMTSKRWPPEYFAAVADALAADWGAQIVLLGGPQDGPLINERRVHLKARATSLGGELSFGEIAALAAGARLYLGNDTGLTHLAAAADAPTVMILGPSDPERYRPFAPHSLALWRPIDLPEEGVASGEPSAWNWYTQGIQVEKALEEIRNFAHRVVGKG